ncbi:MAG: sulfur carrier protein ThiS [Gammaproteobacteria bacterium]|nr:sulfur carrier protein ThiS [Gammaproteobacteria bacterium]MCP5459952.1 sulfur carrier protein ThiS [Gammaproteobacteria bacterium]
MNIKVNAEDKQVEAATLAALCHELGYPEQGVATAVNGEFVPRQQRASQVLRDGDSVEILAPMQGG